MRCGFQFRRRFLRRFAVACFTSLAIVFLYSNVYTSSRFQSFSENTQFLHPDTPVYHGLSLEFTPARSALNATDRNETIATVAGPPRKSDKPSQQQTAQNNVTTTKIRTGVNINISGPHPSACLDKKTMKSSKITKLGSYPQTKGFLTIGIASIVRPQGENYLIKTIQGLINNTNEENRREIFIVIFLADLDEAPKSTALTEISNLFEKYINDGFIRVIIAPKDYYPPLSNLKTKFRDNQNRIFWRSKQNIDFAFLMCYCHGLSQYYLHLEDDVLPAPSFYPKLRDFISSIKKPWPILDASYMGHVAKFYHGNDLENVATYFYLMYDESPVDWLIIFWRKIKYDRPYTEEFIFPPAALFEHMGSHSSFIENKRRDTSKETYFDQYDVKYKGLNPSAIVRSEMISNHGQAQDAYNKGYGYFWAKEVKKDDYIMIEFTSTVTVRKVFVDTGSYIALKDNNQLADQLQSAVLQASLDNIKEQGGCKKFETIGEFKKGKAEVTFDGGKSMTCLRILVLSPQPNWVFFREIDVWQV